ncbi:response regulator transcription factor [Pontibaca methylaminivorans]|uniref:Two component transcriptional regulator, LuxR family n=1 Tax=Pontibaca methylaminivorans TaxID=515897 RepID=A0A1R3WTP8_9RHOB|nr:response regulator transcription factor [Pontibaca methylaminivorans]SIT80095.1 two component transcriptional regulator, LuxR family [Pontibaca methylaminivorans]
MSSALSMEVETSGIGTPVSILIADDHWVVRESLKHVARTLRNWNEIEEASSFDEALAVLERNPTIGLVVIDLMMPGAAAFPGLQELRSRFPAIPVVVISVYEDPEHVLEAIRHGVVGYIPKSAGAAQIKQALSRVIAGEVSFPRDILARAHVTPEAERPDTRQPARVEPQADLRLLTRRETEVLAALGRGEALQDIADMLDISRQTVRVHLGNAMKKLATPTREAVIRLAVENSTQLQQALAVK